MNIVGERIFLRAIERSDLPQLHLWSNTPEIARGLGEIHFPSSSWHQDKWFERIQEDLGTVRLAVQDLHGKLIGYTGFWRINWRDRRAEHAVVIADASSRGQGFGREVIRTCSHYAFREMGLRRLDAHILETNAASLHAYQACGFQIEGKLREHAFRDGSWINRLLLGLIVSDYEANERSPRN